VFTLGIGSGASNELISKAAAFGNGKAEFVSDTSLIDQKVISLLDSSLDKRFYNFILDYNSNDVEFIYPDLSELRYIRGSKPIELFVFFKPEV